MFRPQRGWSDSMACGRTPGSAAMARRIDSTIKVSYSSIRMVVVQVRAVLDLRLEQTRQTTNAREDRNSGSLHGNPSIAAC